MSLYGWFCFSRYPQLRFRQTLMEMRHVHVPLSFSLVLGKLSTWVTCGSGSHIKPRSESDIPVLAAGCPRQPSRHLLSPSLASRSLYISSSLSLSVLVTQLFSLLRGRAPAILSPSFSPPASHIALTAVLYIKPLTAILPLPPPSWPPPRPQLSTLNPPR